MKRPCHCCAGTGEEFDDVAVGVEMRSLRQKKKFSLEKTGRLMKPKLTGCYLCDLEYGRRHWNAHLIAEYRRVCS